MQRCIQAHSFWMREVHSSGQTKVSDFKAVNFLLARKFKRATSLDITAVSLILYIYILLYAGYCLLAYF